MCRSSAAPSPTVPRRAVPGSGWSAGTTDAALTIAAGGTSFNPGDALVVTQGVHAQTFIVSSVTTATTVPTVDELRRRELEELAAVESVLATGSGGDTRATLASLAAAKRARLDGLDDG